MALPLDIVIDSMRKGEYTEPNELYEKRDAVGSLLRETLKLALNRSQYLSLQKLTN